MVRADSDVRNPQKFFLIAHAQVAEVRSESHENEFNRNSVVVSVDNGRVGIDVGFPASSLQIYPKSMRRNIAENFVLRELTGDEDHG